MFRTVSDNIGTRGMGLCDPQYEAGGTPCAGERSEPIKRITILAGYVANDINLELPPDSP